MVTCTLGDKKYSVDFISGRALREMEPASKMYAKVVSFAQAAALPAQDAAHAEALAHVRWYPAVPLARPAVGAGSGAPGFAARRSWQACNASASSLPVVPAES